MDEKITAKQQRFIEEYLVDCNATQAAIRAGYSEKSAQQIGAENLLKPVILTAIDVRRAALSKKLEIDAERVLREYAAIAFAQLTDYVQIATKPHYKFGVHPLTGKLDMIPVGGYQQVTLTDTATLPEYKLAVLAGIKQGENGIEIKMHDKIKALEALGRHLGLFNDKLQLEGGLQVNFSGEGYVEDWHENGE